MFDQGAPITVTNRRLRRKILTLIEAGEFDEISKLATPKMRVEAVRGAKFQVKDETVVMDGEKLPRALSNRLIAMVDAEINTDPFLNFWENLKKNPSEDSRKDLFAFLEANHVPITPDGHFIAYKGVTNEFKDTHTRTMDNSPGRIVRMRRKDVDPNRNNTCSSGLHVAAFRYAKGFSGVLLDVKVNPRDVVTVPPDYNEQKIRVCRYEVLGVHEEHKEHTKQVMRKKAKANTLNLAGRKRGASTFIPVTKEALDLLLVGDGRKPISIVVTDARSRFVLVTREKPAKTKFAKTFKRGKPIFVTKDALETAKIGNHDDYVATKTKLGIEVRPAK
jgi:hypothetical protein